MPRKPKPAAYTGAIQVLPPMPQRTGPLSAPLADAYELSWLRPRMQRFLEHHDPQSLLAELAIARGLLEHFLETYEAQNAWFKAWGDSFADPEAGIPPKPVRLLYPDEALKYIQQITRCAEAIQAMKLSDAMGRSEARWVIVQFGDAVEDEVDKTEGSETWGKDLLMRIRDRWLKIWV